MLQKTKYVFLGIFIAALGLWGLAVTIPNSFSSGEVVSAAKMNQNFQALKDAVDALEAKLAAVPPGQLTLPSQQGKLAYAWIYSDGTADSDYQFNSAGGAITGTKLATGQYEVTIPNIALNPGGNVQVTGYGSLPLFCNVGSWGTIGSDTKVKVYCFNTGGTAADSSFSLLAVR
ncbi:hypothetical protein Ocepr_2146 [Oceanithermus profundus DSM 14977]|uniref:Uncharacterized protein n=1 Tax=Oceanithermus profundus (strain DSM 14977 / NBRC 100410 / VKM B-2274 / 506) TaxID=670487 RepID=E4U5C2_OCEP5|nr:hypothetical protein [Oceanithermus profundus]ADR37596.1 hypothetical protein Ocepr_2146 [Oceanithermus profundus DSM 14977]